MFFASILSGCLLGITSASVIQIRSTDQPLEPIGLGDFKPRCARLNDTRFGDFNSGIQLEKINVSSFFPFFFLSPFFSFIVKCLFHDLFHAIFQHICLLPLFHLCAQTIYSFGDSWTDNGNRVGGKPLPPVKPKQSCPFYGGQWSHLSKSIGKAHASVLTANVCYFDVLMTGRPTNGKMWTEWLIELVGNGAEVKNYAVSGATVDHEMWKSAVSKTIWKRSRTSYQHIHQSRPQFSFVEQTGGHDWGNW